MASFVRYENSEGLGALFRTNDPIAYCKVASSWDGVDILSQLPTYHQFQPLSLQCILR